METQKKAMLSQPMAGKTDLEIIKTRERAVSHLKKLQALLNSLFHQNVQLQIFLLQSHRLQWVLTQAWE